MTSQSFAWFRMTNVPGLYKVDENTGHRGRLHILTECLDSWRGNASCSLNLATAEIICVVWSFPEANGLGPFSFNDNEKRFYVDEVKDVVEKYKALLRGSNTEERVAEYDKQLKDQSGYRALVCIECLFSTLIHSVEMVNEERLRRLGLPWLDGMQRVDRLALKGQDI